MIGRFFSAIFREIRDSLRGLSRREFMMSTARCTALAMSEGLTALNSKTVERLKMALKTQK